MKLLVIRHAIAEDQAVWAKTGESDDQRPLTDAGRKKMKRGAKGLNQVVDSIDLLATSPLTRAVQTAEIVARRFKGAPTTVATVLTPDQSNQSFLEWLRSIDRAELVAIVGHEPHLSGLVSWLVSGRDGSVIELKKGAACLLEFEGQPAAGGARLLWALTPEQLRALAEK
jgi:phosphohistidine phosphatase